MNDQGQDVNMGFTQEISPDCHLLEYEVGINLLRDPFPHVGMCQYDARRFDGATLFKVLQVHPYMIVQGQTVRNPFYLQPDEFLATLKAGA
jgi:hypothetical protein